MPVAPSKIMPNNNIVERERRAIKRIVRPMLGFKSMHCARTLLAGFETIHMIRKGQLGGPKGRSRPQQSSSTLWPFERGRRHGFVQADRLIATEPFYEHVPCCAGAAPPMRDGDMVGSVLSGSGLTRRLGSSF
jgi:hypothetical protein